MLGPTALRALTGWCQARGMTWQPGRAADGAAAVLLERRGTEAMLLVVDRRELRLLDPAGQMLAAASALPALLDALDGGVADSPARIARAA